MNMSWFSAGCLAILICLVHSVLGERLIFRRMRAGEIIPVHGQPLLLERHVRILWASWHIVSIFGLAIAAILFSLAAAEAPADRDGHLRLIIAAASGGSGALVLIATKARHPGWIGLFAIAALVALN